jgi:choline dehydrogenase-like flavoprotein
MFDYVIVGAGSAGCVLAARLSEDPDVRVAVIEAGPPDDEAVIHMPLAFRQLWESRFDWVCGASASRNWATGATSCHAVACWAARAR